MTYVGGEGHCIKEINKRENLPACEVASRRGRSERKGHLLQ